MSFEARYCIESNSGGSVSGERIAVFDSPEEFLYFVKAILEENLILVNEEVSVDESMFQEKGNKEFLRSGGGVRRGFSITSQRE